MAFEFDEWLSVKSKDEVLFLFNGEVNSTLIADSLDKIEDQLEAVKSKIRKKIYNVLVECMQNLFHHSETLPAKPGFETTGKYAACILSKNSVGYHITTGNFINHKQKEFLSKHLSHINTLDRDALKELYKEILNNQEFSDKGGGGLGMVDISRKSGSKLDYSFHEYKDNFYFFSLSINILE